MHFSIISEEIVFDYYYQIKKAQIKYDSFTKAPISATRYAFERGDSVAILLYEKETNSFLFTNQFRYPTCKEGSGWILEIPAGSKEAHESAEECVVREVLEELGYAIAEPELISTFFTSPGGSTERMSLFFKEVSIEDKIQKGGGISEEKEDIQIVKIPISQFPKRLSEIVDAKTLVALQWYLLKPD